VFIYPPLNPLPGGEYGGRFQEGTMGWVPSLDGTAQIPLLGGVRGGFSPRRFLYFPLERTPQIPHLIEGTSPIPLLRGAGGVFIHC